MSSLTRWWWVRHAPVVGVNGVIYGANDVECDVSDEAQFKALADTLPSGAVWVTSRLSRAIKTAKAISEAGAAVGLDFPEPAIEEDLGEQNFGDWQGLSWDRMKETDAETYDAFWADPARSRPPGGESFTDLIARTGAVIERLTERHKGRDIVAVAHGVTSFDANTGRAASSGREHRPTRFGGPASQRRKCGKDQESNYHWSGPGGSHRGSCYWSCPEPTGKETP